MQVPLTLLSQITAKLLERSNRPIKCDGVEWSPDEAAALDGLFPSLISDAARVWAEATGNLMSVEFIQDQQALLGCQPATITAISTSSVVLALAEVIQSLDQGNNIVLDPAVIRLQALHPAATRQNQCP